MFEELANAIILQAAQDFRQAYRRVKHFPNDTAAMGTVREITEFFQSDDFCCLTDLDGPALLNKLMMEVDRTGIR